MLRPTLQRKIDTRREENLVAVRRDETEQARGCPSAQASRKKFKAGHREGAVVPLPRRHRYAPVCSRQPRLRPYFLHFYEGLPFLFWPCLNISNPHYYKINGTRTVQVCAASFRAWITDAGYRVGQLQALLNRTFRGTIPVPGTWYPYPGMMVGFGESLFWTREVSALHSPLASAAAGFVPTIVGAFPMICTSVRPGGSVRSQPLAGRLAEKQ